MLQLGTLAPAHSSLVFSNFDFDVLWHNNEKRHLRFYMRLLFVWSAQYHKPASTQYWDDHQRSLQTIRYYPSSPIIVHINVHHCQNWRARQLTALNSYKRHDRDLAQLRPAQPAQPAAPVAGPGLYFTLMDHQHPGYCSIQCGKFPNLNNRQVAHKMDAGIFINYHNSDHISFCSTTRLCWCTAVLQ